MSPEILKYVSADRRVIGSPSLHQPISIPEQVCPPVSNDPLTSTQLSFSLSNVPPKPTLNPAHQLLVVFIYSITALSQTRFPEILW